LSIVIDDINSNIEFGVGVFKSILIEKITFVIKNKIFDREESKLSLQECEDAIEAAYIQCLDFVHAEVHALREPPKWDSKKSKEAADFQKLQTIRGVK